MTTKTHTITTAKGTHTGTLEDVCRWQAEMQGSFADIDGVSVDAIDFDVEDLDATLAAVQVALYDLVLVEVMPGHLRASHEAAGNSGRYPMNGARRFICERDAVSVDEWTEILRDARQGDVGDYTMDRDGSRAAQAAE